MLDRGGVSVGPMQPDRPFAVLLPGAGHPSKVLPVEVLADVGRSLGDRGLDVVAAWGPGERERADAIASAGGEAVAIAPPTDLTQLAGLLGRATVVIGGDTGPTHLAASLHVPTLGVFLATDWRRNGPLGVRTDVVSTASLPGTVRPDRASTALGRPPTASDVTRAVDRLLAQKSNIR